MKLFFGSVVHGEAQCGGSYTRRQTRPNAEIRRKETVSGCALVEHFPFQDLKSITTAVSLTLCL